MEKFGYVYLLTVDDLLLSDPDPDPNQCIGIRAETQARGKGWTKLGEVQYRALYKANLLRIFEVAITPSLG